MGKPGNGSAQIRGTLLVSNLIFTMPIPSQVCLSSRILMKQKGVETGRAAPKSLIKAQGEGTVQTTNVLTSVGNDSSNGGENRGGMNPGVGGSNPSVDTNAEISHIKSIN